MDDFRGSRQHEAANCSEGRGTIVHHMERRVLNPPSNRADVSASYIPRSKRVAFTDGSAAVDERELIITGEGDAELVRLDAAEIRIITGACK
jgi:hypothetical protein